MHRANNDFEAMRPLLEAVVTLSRGQAQILVETLGCSPSLLDGYELEKDLIDGSLKVKGLPDAWDAKMRDYLDISTQGNFIDGCLQDAHYFKEHLQQQLERGLFLVARIA